MSPRALCPVNELVGRDTDDNGTDNHTLAYDAAGNMTDDDAAYTFEWDAFYRLRKVRNSSNSALVSEYWYNGLGYLVTRHQDTDTDGDVDGSDVKFHTAYDERWRQVATFRGSDANPKEQFVYHCAGDGGWGGRSYIDTVLLRDRDMTNGWTGAADGTLEERTYYLQNWRADVVVIVDDTGEIQESVRYSAYGVPLGLPKGDADADGDCDADDFAIVNSWVSTPSYNVCGDFNLDGVLDVKDETIATDNDGAVHGRGVLSDIDFGNRKGYAGYEGDAKLSAKWHVRHRVLGSVPGRWLRRDSLGYVDGPSLAQYARSSPVLLVDADGRISQGGILPLPPQFIADTSVHDLAWDIYRVGPHVMQAAREVSGVDGTNSNSEAPRVNFMRHCFASCVSCRLWGPKVAEDMGHANEVWEAAKGADFFSQADYRANDFGRKCCGSREDCELCCRSKWLMHESWLFPGEYASAIRFWYGIGSGSGPVSPVPGAPGAPGGAGPRSPAGVPTPGAPTGWGPRSPGGLLAPKRPGAPSCWPFQA